ncbi:MraY family glycosyltransferase [Nonomuraea aurantiaca]|uniref:MraY family glycosyltransferase n=1 Tax=Nonomuraea aurantiaca TaxID=2878562 RepID=UPI001CDA0D46|nr:MraY family glycosyltransferase [Nonomuraea aurantiaca]MCA2223132.1 undecaprenyl/decaprenyl-phosphate alpha-N-acetylglucosaminyl 1-phosphate transferase [Nonomuraea aurantiaca]
MNGALALAAGVAACLFSATAAIPLKRLAVQWGLTDHPGGHKTHARPTPYLGGIAIALATIVPTVAAVGPGDRRLTAILLAGMAVALLGLIDDFESLTTAARLVVETVAASGVVLSGVQLTVTGGWPDGPITVMWIVVMTNSFNLLDNMDGSLGAVTAVSAAFLAGTAFLQAWPALGLLLVALAGATLGFLLHNWPPAKMFMGDTGSLFIGFVLTCSAVVLVMRQGPVTVAAGLLLPTFVATIDTGVVFISRMRAGRSPLSGGTDHVSHRLRRIGLGARLAATALGVGSGLAGALYLAMAMGWVSSSIAAVTAGGIALVVFILLQGVNVYAPVRHLKARSRIRERRR